MGARAVERAYVQLEVWAMAAFRQPLNRRPRSRLMRRVAPLRAETIGELETLSEPRV